jgi:glycosyltransferase involved in cell wall biosynthesis
MKIAHVVVTDAFAGTERYVAEVAAELAIGGHALTVIGGNADAMRAHLVPSMRFVNGSTVPRAVRALASHGPFDIVHAHLTYAEAAVVLAAKPMGAKVVATKHLATPRGQSAIGRRLAPMIVRGFDCEIAISNFVARSAVPPIACVIRNGVRLQPAADPSLSRNVVMVQRLEPEKDTLSGLRAWFASDLARSGWRLLIAGDGAQRHLIEAEIQGHADADAVRLLGHVEDMDAFWPCAGILLAPASAEPLGLSVLEAMARAVPVVATASGGHLETAAAVSGSFVFAPGDVSSAATALVELAKDHDARAKLGLLGQQWQRQHAALDDHVGRLLEVYARVLE